MIKHGKSFDIEFGRLSGIPECCIQFFTDVWQYHSYNQTEYYVTRVSTELQKKTNYILCLDCFKKGHVVKLIKGSYKELKEK